MNLHSLDIAHGDIKPVGLLLLLKELVAKPSCSQSNILVRRGVYPEAVLADFGSACPLATPAEMPEEVEERCTPSFMAPELLLPAEFGLEKAGPSKKADIYAFGMTAYQVLTGNRPFHPVRKAGIIRAVISGERPAKPENAEEIGMTDTVWNLLQECWQEDRTKRPDIVQVTRRIYDLVRPPTPSTLNTHPGVFRRLLERMSGPVRNQTQGSKRG